MNIRLRNRLGLRIAVPAVAVFVAIAAFAVLVERQQIQHRQGRSLDAYAGLLARVILNDVHDAMLDRNHEQIDAKMRGVAALEAIRDVRILNASGQVRFASDKAAVGTFMATTEAGCVDCHPDGQAPLERRTLRFQELDGKRMFRSVEPIVIGSACVKCHKGQEDKLIGLLVVDLDDELLTGELRRSSRQLALGVAAVALLAGLLLAALLRWQVLAPLRELRGTLEQLGRGERSDKVAGAKGGAIEEMTRSVQLLSDDLEARYAIERESRRLTAALERHPGPALMIGPDERVYAANGRAIRAFSGEGYPPVLGSLRRALPRQHDCLGLASEQGWALPEEGLEGPAVVALRSHSGEALGWVEVHAGAEPDEDDKPIGVDALSRDLDELLCATALAQGIAATAERWRGVLRFDLRLVQARRLHNELVAVAVAAAEAREQVELQGIGTICLWEMRRRLPEVHWHESLETGVQVHAVRHQLRALINRLALAAGDHAGRSGHVLLFAQRAPATGATFIAAWASGEGAPPLVDPAGSPPLASAIALGHGGALEVARGFDIQPLCETRGLRLPGPTIGALFAVQLLASGDRHR